MENEHIISCLILLLLLALMVSHSSFSPLQVFALIFFCYLSHPFSVLSVALLVLLLISHQQ